MNCFYQWFKIVHELGKSRETAIFPFMINKQKIQIMNFKICGNVFHYDKPNLQTMCGIFSKPLLINRQAAHTQITNFFLLTQIIQYKKEIIHLFLEFVVNYNYEFIPKRLEKVLRSQREKVVRCQLKVNCISLQILKRLNQ